MSTPAFTVCACADPWCREHGCRLANGLKYGVQPNYGPAYVVPNVPRPLTKDDLARTYETGKAEERTAVVAMLRAEARAVGASPDERRVLNAVARDIERGEHRREKP